MTERRTGILVSGRQENAAAGISFFGGISLCIDISAVRPESRFSELGIDSLDTVELLMSLEDEIGIEIDLDQKVETIADLDQFIQSKKG